MNFIIDKNKITQGWFNPGLMNEYTRLLKLKERIKKVNKIKDKINDKSLFPTT
jgi:hypothetical protein